MVLASVLLVAACGSARDSVVINDPNTTGSFASPDQIGEPVAHHGADVLERSRAISRAEARLIVARSLRAEGNATSATVQITTARTELLPAIEARLRVSRPQLAQQISTELTNLASLAADGGASRKFTERLDHLAGPLLQQAELAVIPASAAKDPAFRAAVLVTVLTDAASSYEQGFATDTVTLDLHSQYELAYGLLLVARTTASQRVARLTRDRISVPLNRLAARSFPGPRRPEHPSTPEAVASRLATITDTISESSNMDITPAPPRPDAPDRLRLLATSIGQVQRLYRSNDIAGAQRLLQQSFGNHVRAAAPSIAGVDPDALPAIEYGTGVELPDAIRRHVPPTQFHALAQTLIANVNSARESVMSELELLAEDADANN